MRTRYYVYPVHVSGAFLSTPSLSSALYMVLLRLLAREYIFASRLLTSCHTDQPLTNEENYILSLVAETFDDSHPNAHAVRLQLTIVCLESGAKQVPWADQLKGRKGGQDEDPVAKDMESYLNKYSHVSIECRLSRHGTCVFLKFFKPGDSLSLSLFSACLHLYTNSLDPYHLSSRGDSDARILFLEIDRT